MKHVADEPTVELPIVKNEVSVKSWAPEEFNDTVTVPVIAIETDNPTQESQVIDLDAVAAAHHMWFISVLSDVCKRDVTVHDLLLNGRKYTCEYILGTRSVTEDRWLPSDLQWRGPTKSLSETMVNIYRLQQQLSASEVTKTPQLRFRIRLELLDLETSILAYAATELIEPKEMSTYATLDLLRKPKFIVPSHIVKRLGFARGYRFEVEESETAQPYSREPYWEFIRSAWYDMTVAN